MDESTDSPRNSNGVRKKKDILYLHIFMKLNKTISWKGEMIKVPFYFTSHYLAGLPLFTRIIVSTDPKTYSTIHCHPNVLETRRIFWNFGRRLEIVDRGKWMHCYRRFEEVWVLGKRKEKEKVIWSFKFCKGCVLW